MKMKDGFVVAFVVMIVSAACAFAADYRSGIEWPEPATVTPGAAAGQAPSDAIVLFDGKDLSQWTGGAWIVTNGELTVLPRSGDIFTKQKFGSCQVHLEFATPPANGFSQHRGNSGLFLMNHYEVQILDSYTNKTYCEGQCGSIYKQFPPYVNVCRKPGQWQTLDVIFTRPLLRCEGDKVVEVVRPAYITVIQNGVVVQNHFAIQGDTFWHKAPEYQVHEDAESIRLQDHGNRMKYRNIWVRPIPDANVIPAPTRLPYFADPKQEAAKYNPAKTDDTKAKAPAKQPVVTEPKKVPAK